MGYSDLQLRAFSKIAYYDLENEFAVRSAMGESVSIYDLLSKKQRKELKDLGIDAKVLKGWKMVAVHDTNDKNGFYACVIETSPGCAAVAFRGSEGMTDIDNAIHDWSEADLQLVNSVCTNQHAEVERFLEKYKDTLNKYDNITMTGHSLGGNLAEYATIMSDKYGLDDNIEQCVSLDGPGFSNEFIAKNYDRILKMGSRMKHYRWSFVGTMLYDLPKESGIEYDYLSVSNSANEHDDEEYNSITRHDMKYLEHKDGKFLPGKQDVLSMITSGISKAVDFMPQPIGDMFVTFLSAGIVAVAVFATAFDYIKDMVIKVSDAICRAVEKLYEWGEQLVIQINEAVVNLIDNLNEWFNSTFNGGYKYASANPEIIVDTYKLRSYAQRLQSINVRISNIDRRMDSLYWRVGLLDLWNLMQADLLTGYSWRLLRCVGYLNDTASEFDSKESSLSGL